MIFERLMKKQTDLLSFLYPQHEKHYRLGVMLNYLPIIIVLILSCPTGTIILPIVIAVTILGILRIPERTYYNILRKDYYSEIEKELPYFIIHVLITTSSSLGLETVFQQIRGSRIYKKFRMEARKFILLTNMGKTTEEALTILYEQSVSRSYGRFLKGLLTMLSSSGEIPKYAYDYLKETTREIEEAWRKYWSSLNSIVEIALLIGLTVMTITFVSCLLEKQTVWLISYLVTGATIITSIVLYASASSLKPVVENSVHNVFSLHGVLSITMVFTLTIFLNDRLHPHYILLIISAIMILSSLPFLYSYRRKSKLEEKVFQEYKNIIELNRIGYSLAVAIDKTSFKTIINKIKRGNYCSFKTSFIDYTLELIQELGGSVRGLLETTYYFLNEIRWYEKVNKRNSVFLEILSTMLPASMYFFSIKTVSNLALNDLVMDTAYLMKALLLPFAVIAVSFNLVITLLLDNVFSTWRSGIATLLLALVCFLIPL